ncbi:MAG: hypothetical protein IK127_06100 [Clostridia bacterium]|nr:hypothetical protein [Clostridia bacterium]
MFDRIGQKIMGLAKSLFIIESILFVGGGIVMFFSRLTALIVSGIVLIILGPILAWLSSWLLYAFGQIADDLHELRNTHNKSNKNNGVRDGKNSQKQLKKEDKTNQSAITTEQNDDTRELTKEEQYQRGIGFEKQEQYQEALDHYEEIAGYKDTNNRIKACYYAIAQSFMSEQKYEDAAISFELSDGYRDAESLRKEALYLQAKIFIGQKRWTPAADILYSIRSYRDVHKLIEEYPALQNAMNKINYKL